MKKSDMNTLLKGDALLAVPIIENFIQQNTKSITFPELDDDNLRPKVWDVLFKYLNNTTENIQLPCLSMIRILSRDKSELEEIITEEFIQSLLKLCFIFGEKSSILPADSRYPDKVIVESLMCLCNLAHNSMNGLKFLSEKNCIDMMTNRIIPFELKDNFCHLNDLHDDIKYYTMRLIFILTAKGPEFRNTVNQRHGSGYLIEYLHHIINNAKLEPEKKTLIFSDTEVSLICEVLKTIFNFIMGINTLDESKRKDFVSLVSACRVFLTCQVVSQDKKNQLHSDVVNILTCLDVVYYNGLSYPVESKSFVDQNYKSEEIDMKALHQILKFLKHKLDIATDVYDQNENLSPILTAMCKSASCCRNFRKYLRSEILPPLTDVHTRPEVGDSIRNQLCRLLTTPVTYVRDLAAHFLFILCKENVGRMVKYTGYGNAAGLFATRGLLGQSRQPIETTQYSSDSDDSDTEEYLAMKHTVNPVTGCYEPPRADPMAGYTEEQKEYEAMKLVNLMDQLNRAGIVQPCRIGPDGRPEPVEHVLQLQEDLPNQQIQKH